MQPRIYHMKRYVQFYYCIIGLWLIGSAVFLFLKLDSLLIAIVLGLVGTCYCRAAIGSSVALSEHAVSVRNGFGEESVPVNEIEGWRKREGGGWILQHRGSARSLRIDGKYAVDDFFLEFISKLRNQNEPDHRFVH